MKIAVIGSRGIEVENLEKYLPYDTSEIVSKERFFVSFENFFIIRTFFLK